MKFYSYSFSKELLSEIARFADNLLRHNRQYVQVGDPLLLQPNPYVRLHDIITETFPLREKKRRGRIEIGRE
jgi:hypothetical protein